MGMLTAPHRYPSISSCPAAHARHVHAPCYSVQSTTMQKEVTCVGGGQVWGRGPILSGSSGAGDTGFSSARGPGRLSTEATSAATACVRRLVGPLASKASSPASAAGGPGGKRGHHAAATGRATGEWSTWGRSDSGAAPRVHPGGHASARAQPAAGQGPGAAVPREGGPARLTRLASCRHGTALRGR